MEEAAMPVTGAAQGKAPRAAFGMSFWLLLLLVETLIMVQVGKYSFASAQAMHYGVAALLLIGGTALCGLAIFAAWYSQNKAMQKSLAAERAQALARKAEAEAKARQKTRLLATMSHEIRTPLNGVIGMLGLMLETELDAEQKNYASIAHGSARSLLSFLDEILDTAKAEAKQAGQDGATELLPLIETVAELMAPRAHGKGIEVSTYVAPSIPISVPFNSLHLRQILFNLAGNAIKFTNHGGVAIEARCNGAMLLIDVRDTGIGMEAEEAARVFAEYEQASNETQRRFGGTGLGLAISKRLAEAMGGTLTVKSVKDKGTTFSLALPMKVMTGAKTEQTLSGRTYGLWLAPSFAAEHLALKLKDLGAHVVYPGEVELENCQAIICDPVEARNLLALRNVSEVLAATPLWVLLNPEERRNLKPVLAEPHTGYLVKPLRAATLLHQLTGRDPVTIATGVEGLRHVAARAKKQKPKGLKLLLVDDTAVNLLLASTMLRKVGHDVTTLTNGPDTIAMITSSKNFDAILLDIEMPRMDGHEVARQIRDLGHTALPILALTGNASPDDVAACLASGMNGHLAKPFVQEDLDEALAKVIRNRAA